MKNVTIVKPIVYGNTAKYFGKKREEDGHTHAWSFYLKMYENEDPSQYIQRVQIKLHDSYPNANKIINKPPYEVSETGWGEFEITVKIYFIDPNEKPLTIFHLLKLFSADQDVSLGKKTLVNEYYDEIIFHEPSQFFHQLLVGAPKLTTAAHKHDTDFKEKERLALEKIQSSKEKVRAEIRELKDTLKQAQENMQTLKDKIETDDLAADDLI
jgi:YEATS domain-containing protein 4